MYSICSRSTGLRVSCGETCALGMTLIGTSELLLSPTEVASRAVGIRSLDCCGVPLLVVGDVAPTAWDLAGPLLATLVALNPSLCFVRGSDCGAVLEKLGPL